VGNGGWIHPRELGPADVVAFLNHLANVESVAAGTQNQALNAISFLYTQVLGLELGDLGEFMTASKRRRVPVVLSKAEVGRLLAALDGTYRLMGLVLYGTGLRLLELLRLRVQDIDFDRNQIVVRGGKGDKYRVTVLPDMLKFELQQHLQRVHLLWEADVRDGFGEVYLPEALARKYPNAAREWGTSGFSPRGCGGGSAGKCFGRGVRNGTRGARAPQSCHAAASCAGDGFAAGGEGGSAFERHHQTGELPHVPAFLRDAFFGEWV
jgi:integrase